MLSLVSTHFLFQFGLLFSLNLLAFVSVFEINLALTLVFLASIDFLVFIRVEILKIFQYGILCLFFNLLKKLLIVLSCS